MRSLRKRHLATLAGVLLAGAVLSAPARAGNAMFTFGEMVRLQALPLESSERRLSDTELVLYQNMEFYVFTVFETLIAANNAAITLHEQPLFCAPEGAFRFVEEGDIANLASYVVDELLGLTEEIGASPERYHPRPASEVLLLALRAAFPCEHGEDTITAMREGIHATE